MAWPLEVLAIVAGDLAYERIRALAPARAGLAHANAATLMSLEPAVLRDVEAWLDRTVNANPVLEHVFGYFYVTMHLAVTVGVLVWLWLRRPHTYARARSALLTLTFGGLAVFWLFPVAPPRLAVPGATDTLVNLGLDAGTGSTGPGSALLNQYAAFPSLHVAWAAWCAWALTGALRGRWRHLAWLYPAATALVVVATANHYVVDVVAGLGFLALAVGAMGPAGKAAAQAERGAPPPAEAAEEAWPPALVPARGFGPQPLPSEAGGPGAPLPPES